MSNHSDERAFTSGLLSQEYEMTPLMYAVLGSTAVCCLLGWYINTHRKDE